MAPVLPFTIWTLRGFVASVPVDIEEAALTDGCSRLSAFWKVIFPLIAPGLVATSIFAFILAWNDYVYAYTILGNSGTIFGQTERDGERVAVRTDQPQPGDAVG